MIDSAPPPDPIPAPPPPPDLSQFQQFTYDDVARLKRVSKQSVMDWVRTGKVPSPIYTGFTARFTPDQVAEIMVGTSAAGTFPVTPSPRAEIAAAARVEADRLRAEAEAKKKPKVKTKTPKKPKDKAFQNGSKGTKQTKSTPKRAKR